VVLPALRNLWSLPRALKPTTGRGPATAAVALLAGGFVCLSTGGSLAATPSTPLADSITQQIRVEENFALATAKVRWQATKGQVLPLLFEPAVLTRINYPSNALKLVQ
jgi:hypothetical protein